MTIEIDLGGRCALVTGAGRGVGRAIANRLAEGGAHIVVNDLLEQCVAAVAAEIDAAGVLLR